MKSDSSRDPVPLLFVYTLSEKEIKMIQQLYMDLPERTYNKQQKHQTTTKQKTKNNRCISSRG